MVRLANDLPHPIYMCSFLLGRQQVAVLATRNGVMAAWNTVLSVPFCPRLATPSAA